MSRAIALIALLVLAGCASLRETPPMDPAALAALEANVPRCSTARNCALMWSAARNWVTSSCGMRIQTISEDFIETFGSIDTAAACRVTRDPDPLGGYSFHVVVSYANHFMPQPWPMVRQFQAVVSAAGAQ
jgi:hypothetical protein